MRRRICSTAALAVLFQLFGGGAEAQDVLLKSRIGTLEIEGTLLGHDRETYRIDTAYGALTVDATSVDCEGPGCPDLGAYVPEQVIVGDARALSRLLAPLLEAYASRLDARVIRRVASESEFALELIPRGDGPALARFVIDTSGKHGAQQAFADGIADMSLTVGAAPTGERLRHRLVALDALVPSGAGGAANPPDSLTDIAPSDGAFMLRSGNDPTEPLKAGCGRRLTPDAFSVRAGDYPLVVPVILTAPAGRRLPEPVRAFLQWVEGPDAGRLLRRLGYVDLLPDPRPVAAQGERLLSAMLLRGPDVTAAHLNELAEEMYGSARSSVTVRFAPGSTEPDLASQSHIARLARDLEAGLYDGQSLTFVGFSDSEGPGEANRRISARRAESVRDRVLTQARLADRAQFSVRAVGFGEALPMACDDTDWGRRINRRVELWIRPGQR